MTRANGVAFDEAALFARSLSHGRGGEAVHVAHATGGGFVDHSDAIGGKHVAVAADAGEAHTEAFGGV